MQHHYAEAFPSHGAVFSEHCHFHVSHDDNGLTLSGRYPASGTDSWESNPPHTVLETASPPWYICPYMAPLGHIVERCGESCHVVRPRHGTASLRGALRSASYRPPVYPAAARSAPLPSGAGSRAGREEVSPCPRHPRLSPQEAPNQVLITLQSCEYRTPLHIDAQSCTREPRSTLSQNTLHPP